MNVVLDDGEVGLSLCFGPLELSSWLEITTVTNSI